MNELIVFENSQFGKITVLEIKGEPWFIGKEIANILGYKKSQNAIKTHCKYVELFNCPISGHVSNVYRKQQIINEKDVYRLIMRSHLKNAIKFQDWVMDVVLPSLRKTGKYEMNKSLPDFSNPADAARAWANEYEAKLKLQEQINDDKPLVAFANQVASSSDNIDFGTFAKIVHDEYVQIGRNRLFNWMRKNKYLQQNNIPYQTMVDKKFCTVIEQVYNTPYGRRLNQQTLITPLGQIYFANKLKEDFGG